MLEFPTATLPLGKFRLPSKLALEVLARALLDLSNAAEEICSEFLESLNYVLEVSNAVEEICSALLEALNAAEEICSALLEFSIATTAVVLATETI